MTFLNVLIAAVRGMENGAILYSWADCPDDQCCGLHAPTSTLTVDNRLTCPILSTEWVDCTDCGWEPVDSDNPPRVINGDMWCAECAVEFGECRGCDRQMRFSVMNTECDFPEGLRWCDRCWDTRGGCTGSCCNGSEYDDDDDEEGAEGESPRRCSSCGELQQHMNLLTEEFVCSHLAKELLDGSIPVKLSHPLPPAMIVPSDCEWVDTVDAAWDEVLSSQPS